MFAISLVLSHSFVCHGPLLAFLCECSLIWDPGFPEPSHYKSQVYNEALFHLLGESQTQSEPLRSLLTYPALCSIQLKQEAELQGRRSGLGSRRTKEGKGPAGTRTCHTLVWRSPVLTKGALGSFLFIHTSSHRPLTLCCLFCVLPLHFPPASF